jgi:DNA ligase-associated metallophosphoesterase
VEEVIFKFQQQTWHLSAGKALYWQEEKALVLSDLHLGKSAHFRKAGIAVPAGLIQEDLFRLQQLITRYHPEKIIVVGDLFHSSENNDVQYFRLWRQQFPHIRFELVKGNHDIMSADLYTTLQITVHETLTLRNIHFIHEPCETAEANGPYVFSGHLHPGVILAGGGRQRLRLPCFYFGKSRGILPAFGRFTGLATLAPETNEVVFAIANNSIFKITVD